jgi:hypothetical protein
VALSTRQKGDAGEYAAAAELAIRGWMIVMADRGAKGIDLFAQSPVGERTCGVQIKTRASGDFHFSENLLTLAEPTADAWVILVTLTAPGERAHFFVIPRNHVSAGLLAYKGYRDAEGKTWPRMLFGEAEFTGYDEAWQLMHRPAHGAPWRMDGWVAEALDEHERDDVFAAIPTLPRPTG